MYSDWANPLHDIRKRRSVMFIMKYKIEFLPVELQGFKKKKITMGNDIETTILSEYKSLSISSLREPVLKIGNGFVTC